MLTGLHFLLTYKCTFECAHCFVFSGPLVEGTFTLEQVRTALDQAVELGTIEMIYFEGGEPFLFYPLLLKGLDLARGRGFRTGSVTNAYFATSDQDAELWLGPLVELGVADLSISDDEYHFPDLTGSRNLSGLADNPARRAIRAAERLGLPVGSICIEPPCLEKHTGRLSGGGVMFRGRAAEKLVEGLPRCDGRAFAECPYEELADPARVHLDCYGNVHLCQGLIMGNIWATPLAQLVKTYAPASHPIVGPLLQGGPALLARTYNVEHPAGYVDACHLCYLARKALMDRFPQFLAPRQVYGLGIPH